MEMMKWMLFWWNMFEVYCTKLQYDCSRYYRYCKEHRKRQAFGGLFERYQCGTGTKLIAKSGIDMIFSDDLDVAALPALAGNLKVSYDLERKEIIPGSQSNGML